MEVVLQSRIRGAHNPPPLLQRDVFERIRQLRQRHWLKAASPQTTQGRRLDDPERFHGLMAAIGHLDREAKWPELGAKPTFPCSLNQRLLKAPESLKADCRQRPTTRPFGDSSAR